MLFSISALLGLIRVSSGYGELKISTSTSVDVEIFRGELNDKVDCRLVPLNDMRVAVYPMLAAIDLLLSDLSSWEAPGSCGVASSSGNRKVLA
ncbi:hypothetical protein Taro_008451 [Colocasia esculenta]|uniref:Uncharacterized protein n=1 Tax=Colocasia esculenta TaxID=4460 RepID=A0A843TTQ6_COLES|nr:hypothetical protein [Colocasia esculenta]